MAKITDTRAAITWGFNNNNFFQKVTVAGGNFPGPCNIIIPFSTYTVTFNLESTTSAIEYSFDGINLHGDMDSTKTSKDLKFENRVISKIWFRVVSGTPVVRVEAWSIR